LRAGLRGASHVPTEGNCMFLIAFSESSGFVGAGGRAGEGRKEKRAGGQGRKEKRAGGTCRERGRAKR